MKYIINFYTKLSGESKVNAQGKAREDVTKTLRESNYKEIKVFRTNYQNPFNKEKNIPMISGLLEYSQVFFKSISIKREDEVVFQDYVSPQQKRFIQLLKKKGTRVIYIVHDIPSLRFKNEKAEKNDIEMLNLADVLVVHNDAMRQVLKKKGITTKMTCLTLFDYYTNDAIIPESTLINNKNNIAFAGNLSKSEFLSSWLELNNLNDIHIRLYGFKPNVDFSKYRNFDYICAFKPENVSKITAGWGLVWDGNSTETCSGALGEYLRLNTSHKFSLYLVCGMPLIVWTNSSLAQWVIDNNVGITIDNLNQIETKISTISVEDYKIMVRNIYHIASNLRKGYYLKEAMNL